MKGYRRRYCPTSVPSRCSRHRYITGAQPKQHAGQCLGGQSQQYTAGDTLARLQTADDLRIDIADGKQLACDRGKNTFFPLHPCSGARDIGQGQQNPDHRLAFIAFITFTDCAPCISGRCRGPQSAVFHKRAQPPVAGRRPLTSRVLHRA